MRSAERFPVRVVDDNQPSVGEPLMSALRHQEDPGHLDAVSRAWEGLWSPSGCFLPQDSAQDPSPSSGLPCALYGPQIAQSKAFQPTTSFQASSASRWGAMALASMTLEVPSSFPSILDPGTHFCSCFSA